MTIRTFFKLFILVDIVVIAISIFVPNEHWLINTQIAFFTSLFSTSATFFAYRKNVLKGIDNEIQMDDKDIVDKLDDPYDLYGEINEEIIENPTKEQILEANKPIKQNHIQNLKKSFFSFASLYRLIGYILVVVGFFYLTKNHIFSVWAYLSGFFIVPLSVSLASLKK